MSEPRPYGMQLNWMAHQGGVPPPNPPRVKKQRPNLTNGLSSLSIKSERTRDSEALPSYVESEETRNEVDEDDLLEPTSQPIEDDIEVEVLPNARRLRRGYSMSSSSGDESHESFRLDRQLHDQLPDSVEQPSAIRERISEFGVEDVTESASRGRKRHGSRSSSQHKRRRSEMDLDIDMDNDGADERDHARWRKHPSSYEPEKDSKSPTPHIEALCNNTGIVVTSLSDSESEAPSSRSTSPRRARDLNQPGHQGFTLSPSLLTHLLATQKNCFDFSQPPREKGLVLYRPLGIPPGPKIVEQWPGQSRDSNADFGGSARFEELDEDEDQGMGGMEVDAEEAMQLD
jgi:hypothetical protein